jgi:hypothetical protein
MNALLQQLPTLIGVLVGAGASFLATSAGERARWRRAQATRWDKRRVDAYAEYGHAVKNMIYIATRIAAFRGHHQVLHPLPPDEGLQLLATADQERGAKWETVLLLGNPATVAAARDWHRSVWRLEHFAQGRAGVEDDWNEAVLQTVQTRQKFYEAARRDLGVGGVPPPGPLLLVNSASSPNDG